MDPPALAYDYEEIAKLLNRRDAESEKLEKRKNILHDKQWLALKRYSELIEKFEAAENINSTVKNLISDKTWVRSSIDQEHESLTKELEMLQEMHNEIKTKTESKSKSFYDNVEELCQEFNKMPFEFDNDNIHQMIKDCIKSISFYKQKIVNAEEEMQILKNIMKNSDNLQDDFSDIKVTKMIQKESLEKYGDPLELQFRLSELSGSNEALMKELQDIKVKYGI